MNRVRPLRAAFVAAVATVLAITALPAPATAAPALESPSVTTLTTNGRTALTYTGYMNGESFQQDGITTFNGWQYTAWWDQDGYAHVARRQTGSDSWQSIRLSDYRTNSTDSHNTISIGISGQDGTIHLAFDMHNNRLKYRTSVTGLATSPGTASWSASSFGSVTNSLAGQNMSSLTYPRFVRAPNGVLQMSIRTGASGAGDLVLFEYRNGSWTYLGQFLNGTWADNNAYLFGIEYDDTGIDDSDLLHLTWTVRESPNASTNHDIYYAYSKDMGRTWRNNDGYVIATTGSDPLIADAADLRTVGIGQNRGLMNQESQVVDSEGHVHVIASHLPPSASSDGDFNRARSNSVLVHYWREKPTKAWHREVLPYTGVLTRADIGVDSQDNVYIASGNSSTRRLSVYTASKSSGWTDWAARYTSSVEYYSDPLLDHDRLLTEDVVSVFAPRYGGSRIDVLDWATAPDGPSGGETITSRHSGLVLDVEEPTGSDGSNVFQNGSDGNAWQQWQVEDVGGGYVQIRNVHSGRCLDVSGRSTSDGGNVLQWSCHGGDNQQWRLEDAGGGYVSVVNRRSGKCLDVDGWSQSSGANVHQWSCHGGDNQQWRF